MKMTKRNVFLALACGMLGLASPFGSLAQYTREPGVVFLDQGWSDEDRLRYYYTSQGSAAIPYDIFLNLEIANGRGCSTKALLDMASFLNSPIRNTTRTVWLSASTKQ